MRTNMIVGSLVAVAVSLAGAAAVGEQNASQTAGDIPKGKQTSLGLYVTAAEAHEKWKAAPEKVKILDVRTPAEYVFIGHPEMAGNIPLAFLTHEWDARRKSLAMRPNPDFVSQVEEWAKPTDTILIICRSGGRSAMAVNMLAQAGFTDVYNIIDGMEGDKVTDPESPKYGKRAKNGWKNSGLPWTYDLQREQMRLPDPQESGEK
jgi:rhodanese-related sulfurtransferase